ncbi:MAG: ABC transporter permease [Tepidisphaeraceae bacterium]
MPNDWFTVRKPLTARRAVALKLVAFLVPLVAWCVVSYVPFVWHPQRLILDSGDSTTYEEEQQLPKDAFDDEQAKLLAAGRKPMVAKAVNPVFLPAPHEVGSAMYTAFTQPPPLAGMPWLYQRIGHSVLLLAEAFVLSCLIAMPLGVLCGTFDFFSKLIEPFIDFMRYMPAPAFGALAIAIFSLGDAPKLAIIFIGLFFNMLLVTANTVRGLDGSLLEAAQTLGASRKRLISAVVIPGTLPQLYTDLRIALGFGWVYLTVAELIGEMSGITEFLDQQRKFRNYPNVYVGIIVLGVLGFLTDQFLGWLGTVLFPWHSRRRAGWIRNAFRRLRGGGGAQSSFDSAPPHQVVLSTEGANVDA